MPNIASHAGHIAERTCVICRKKKAQSTMFRFIIISGKYIIDPYRRLPGRGYYCCKTQECLKKLDKWLQKRQKRKRKRK